MIFITSSELNVTNYDRMIDNCKFPYQNEIILIFKKSLGCWPSIFPHHSPYKVNKPLWIPLHFISKVDVVVLYKGGKSILPDPLQVSKSFLLPFPDTVSIVNNIHMIEIEMLVWAVIISLWNYCELFLLYWCTFSCPGDICLGDTCPGTVCPGKDKSPGRHFSGWHICTHLGTVPMNNLDCMKKSNILDGNATINFLRMETLLSIKGSTSRR